MLIIRLTKTGKRNKPNFRIVLIESKFAPKSGKFLEILGSYNPHQKEISLKEERIKYWLSQGVKTSETVHNLLIRQGVIKGSKIKKNIRKKKKTEETESDFENKQESVENKEEKDDKEIIEEKKTEKVEDKENKEIKKEEENKEEVDKTEKI